MKKNLTNLELIDKIVSELYDEYNISSKYDNMPISKNALLNKYRLKLAPEEIRICNGISQNGKKCYRKALKETDYCRIHNFTVVQKINDIQKSQYFYLIDKKESNESFELNDNDNLILKFIEDMFYYIDDKFIYDRDTLEKVGYIKNDEFIFTGDPFILNQ